MSQNGRKGMIMAKAKAASKLPKLAGDAVASRWDLVLIGKNYVCGAGEASGMWSPFPATASRLQTVLSNSRFERAPLELFTRAV